MVVAPALLTYCITHVKLHATVNCLNKIKHGSQRTENGQHTAMAHRRTRSRHDTDAGDQQKGVPGSLAGPSTVQDRPAVWRLHSDLYRRFQNHIWTSRNRMLHPAKFHNPGIRGERPPHQWSGDPHWRNDSQQTSTGTYPSIRANNYGQKVRNLYGLAE